MLLAVDTLFDTALPYSDYDCYKINGLGVSWSRVKSCSGSHFPAFPAQFISRRPAPMPVQSKCEARHSTRRDPHG
jgi:hypothetical protein